jgi:ATP/maltotriose-dependent transcriptional regulator MalT
MLAPLVARTRASGSAELAGQLQMLGLLELNAGNLRRAHELLAEAVDLAGQTGRLDTELYSTFRLGWVEGLLGDVEQSRRTCHRAIWLAEHGSGFVRGARLSLGYLESSLEHYDEAWSFLDPANPLTGIVSPQRPVVAVPEQVEVLVGLGRTGEASALLEPYEQRATALARTFALARVAHCRGLILAAEGDLAGAETAATRAVEINAEHRWAVHLGRSLLALGSVQRRRGGKAHARATLEQSVAVLDDAGAVIWRDRARRELGRIGGRSAPSGSELSATETSIAELVASGCSNAEVAHALHLSRKTVEWNLSKIYRKLGVRSRTELAARSKSGEFTG